ncbi:unnamed protein product [Meloidogyne enterolobii]|uniref:Uncharacterized protein n=1 Tax=Meloidogyne enterolobii TaxID=390850 RepID=A0ACB0YI42_MELEN
MIYFLPLRISRTAALLGIFTFIGRQELFFLIPIRKIVVGKPMSTLHILITAKTLF